MIRDGMTSLRQQIEERCRQLGFSLFGVTAAQASPGFDRLKQWIELGYSGTMDYIPRRLEAYRHPDFVLAGCKSAIMLGLPYTPSPHTKPSKQAALSARSESIEAPKEPIENSPEVKIGSYACGAVDYHDLIRDLLNAICGTLVELVPGSSNRGVVDTAPLMERDFAQLAGLGWIGKNTLLLNRQAGSYFFLAAILTDIELVADEPFPADHCGSCTACLDACPTSAFEGPHLLNASRCISYLTIEHRGKIEAELSEKMGDWLFGCDVCQMVCPWNRKSDPVVLVPLQHTQRQEKTSLTHWLTMDETNFRTLYRKTPFWRTKLEGMQRNAMIVAANQERQDLVPLIKTFLDDKNPTLASTAMDTLARLEQT